MCKHAVKKLPYLLRYVPNQYKTRQMCDKAILQNGGTLKFVPNYKMCNKAVDNYSHELELVSERYKTQKMSDKSVSTYPSTIKFFPECIMIQELCDKSVNRCFFIWFFSWSI